MRTLLIAALAASTGYSIPLNILNPSFETASLGIVDARGFAANLVPGTTPTGGTLASWTYYGNSTTDFIGAVSPSPGGINWSSVWYDGLNIAYVRPINAVPGPASGLEQTLSDTLQLNSTYTLGALIGRPTTALATFNYSLELWAGTTLLGSASNLSLAPNSAAADSLTVVIGATHSAQNQSLRVRLQSSGPATEGYFDLVSGSVTSNGPETPEPAGFALLGAGLVLLAALRRK